MKKNKPTSTAKSATRVTKDDLVKQVRSLKTKVAHARERLEDADTRNRHMNSRLTAVSIALTKTSKLVDTLKGELAEANHSVNDAVAYAQVTKKVAEKTIGRLQAERNALMLQLRQTNMRVTSYMAANDATQTALHIVVHGNKQTSTEPLMFDGIDECCDTEAAQPFEQAVKDEFERKVIEDMDLPEDGELGMVEDECTFPDCNCFDE